LTVEAIKPGIEELLLQVRKPLTYVAAEESAVFKPKAKLNFCLIYPDLYELGIGSLGLNILYSVLNSQKDVWAQRAYMPDLDMQEILANENKPLFSLEEGRPLKDFDILGFSLPHELCYTNILQILKLSHIPIKSEERDDSHPLIIAGGNGAYNPWPLAPFIDAFVVGEGEEVIIEIAEKYVGAGLKPARKTFARGEQLKALSEIQGVWVPRGPRHPSAQSEQAIIKKRLIKDINKITHEPLIPVSKGEKRMVVELMRGCTSGCRFCQAGFIYRPVREKEAKRAYEEALEGIGNCGLNQLSLLSLSSSDYSQIEPLAAMLSNTLSPKNISMTLPSLRLDNFSINLLDQISAVKKGGLTFAIEAGSERLRKLINKRLTEEQILKILGAVFEKGWPKVKLYFMVGLPTETSGDLEELVRLVDRIAATAKEKLPKNVRNRLSINISVSNFVPKPHTPFQWVAQDSLETLKKKQRFLMDNIRGRFVKLSWHNAEQSTIEGVIARGGEKVAEVIEEAFKAGAQFDNFSDRFDFSVWQGALKKCNLKPEDCLGPFSVKDELPWDFIDCGVSKSFLQEEYSRGTACRAPTEIETGDCRFSKCPKCGLCNKEVKNRFSKTVGAGFSRPNNVKNETVGRENRAPTSAPPLGNGTTQSHRYKYRIILKKDGLNKYLSHLEWISFLQRNLRKADLELKMKGKFNPRPKLSYSTALPVGRASKETYVDFEILDSSSLERVEEKLKAVFADAFLELRERLY